jgi:hypothetical protein
MSASPDARSRQRGSGGVPPFNRSRLNGGAGPREESSDHIARLQNHRTGCQSAGLCQLHDFLSNSKAEWSIAKNGYVKSHSGWFSCRSACYLAAGKPVVVQDTGWSDHLPSGDGALCFTTLAGAVDAIEAVARDYTHHCAAARAYARTYFDAIKVCAELLE